MKRLLASILLSTTMFSMANAAEMTAPLSGGLPIVVIAVAKIKPEGIARFDKAVAELVAKSRTEKGNILFTSHKSIKGDATYGFFERWASESDLDTHLNSEQMKAFFNSVSDLFEPGYPNIMRMQEVNTGRPLSEGVGKIYEK